LRNAVTNALGELFLNRLVNLAGLPADTVAHVADGDFGRYASSAPEADLDVIPIALRIFRRISLYEATSEYQYSMEQHLPMYGVLILLFDAFSLLECDVDWHV